MYDSHETLQRLSESPDFLQAKMASEWVKTGLSAVSAPVVLVAEDDADMRALLVAVLRKSGYEVKECKDGWALLGRLRNYIIPAQRPEHFDLIISDIRMPGMTGLEIMEIAEFAPGFPPVILITAFGDEQTHAAAERLGAVAVFDKPFEIDTMLAKVGEVAPWPR